MGEIDPGAFEDLSRSEPDTPAQRAAWVGHYRQLIEMMERQLEETKSLAEAAPEAMRLYLARENIAILTQEIEAFKQRIAHWNGHGDSQS